MANPNDSTNDLLRVFETDSSIAPSMTAASSSAPGESVSSNIPSKINATGNNQEEDELLLQLLNDNDNVPRDSNRRSSILKVNEKGNFRRTSQRVSWAQKYQFKEVRSDGSIVITSQEMNKFDSESPTALQSAAFDVNRQAPNENASILTSPMAPCSAVIDDPVQELANLEVLQKVKEKVKNSKSYTGILSRFYNKEDEEDRQTVIHTAINRFGIDIDPTTTTDLNCLFDAANLKEKPDLLNDSDNANLNNFVQQFVEQQKKQEQFVQLQSELTTSTAASSHQPPGISPIAGNIKANMCMNMSTYQQVCNSTGVGTDQPSPEEYWFDTADKMVESMDDDKGTMHDTTMMDIDIDSSDSNEKISQSAAVIQPEEPSKDSSALLALLKGTNNEADLATDTLEFSFQKQPQLTADEAQPSLGAILVDGIANSSDKENVNQEEGEETQNDRQVPETDLLDILPSVTKNADTMDITMTDDVEGALEPVNNNSDKENVLFASNKTASQEEPPKPAIVSSPSKRPYDFTMLDSIPEQQQQQQSKYIKRISNIPRPITAIAKAPVVERVVRKQIKLDFNQPSTSRNVDNSPNTSRCGSSLLNSPFPPQLAINRVRKSIGFGLKERLIQKVQALQQHREKEAQQQQLELSTRDQTAPASAAVSEPTENDTQNDNSKMDFTEQSMSLADGTGEKQFSVKLRNSDAVVETKLPSEPKSIAEEENLDEVEKSNCFDISNFTMPDLSSDSDGISFKLDDFDDEIADSSDALCVDQAASGSTGESSSEMNQLIDMVSQSIQSMNDEKMIEESPLNASTSLFNSTAYDIKKILNDTCEFTKFEDLSWLATESLNDFKKFAFEDILYRCISSLDFNALHIRIHKMEPDTCEVRYLWGTLEVRIKFGAIKEKRIDGSQVREMTFHLISLLSSKKAISHEVMRGLEEKALYDGDDMFLRYEEEHRPILILAHNYVINRCDEEYHELIRKYPDSSKLLDLLHDLSNIVDTARQLCVELRHMYSREFMQILDPDSEGRFRFSIRLLGVRLVSHFQVHFTFDPMKYPFEVIRPEIVVPERDQHLYPIDQFKAALLLVKPGNFNYLTNLVQGARLFICALRKVLISNLKQQKQKAEMQSAKLLD